MPALLTSVRGSKRGDEIEEEICTSKILVGLINPHPHSMSSVPNFVVPADFGNRCLAVPQLENLGTDQSSAETLHLRAVYNTTIACQF